MTDATSHSWSERKVKELISNLPASCDHKWTLQQMADQCGLQRTRLSTLFQKLTGSTPMEYLARLRMEHAKMLLRETELKIIEIALECGFSTSQHFANTFRRTTNMTPSAYRRYCAGLTEAELRHWASLDFRSEQEEKQRIEAFSQ